MNLCTRKYVYINVNIIILASKVNVSMFPQSRPASMVLEPVLREPGSITFQWLEIQRTKTSLLQQLEMHTNFSLNDTLTEFGLVPKEAVADCDFKCPELDACIDRNLWCDGKCVKTKCSQQSNYKYNNIHQSCVSALLNLSLWTGCRQYKCRLKSLLSFSTIFIPAACFTQLSQSSYEVVR